MYKTKILNGKIENKNALYSIAIIALLIFSAILIAVPPVNAALEATFPNISAEPKIVGVGQVVTINGWNQPPPPPPISGVQTFYHDMVVKVTSPTGIVTTYDSMKLSSVLGSVFYSIVPSEIGTYKVDFTYPGETYSNGIQRAAGTASTTFIVQEEAVPNWPYPTVPLPTGYWTRPISAGIYGWWSISGNWLQSGYNGTGNSFNPSSIYPGSPHIMWTKELKFGGIAGGVGGEAGLTGDGTGGYGFGDVSYHVGEAYQSEMSNPLIIMGRLYYPTIVDDISGGVNCVDLRTGELLWNNPTMSYSQAMLFNYESVNQGGTHAYLWSFGSTYILYDAYTGNQICNFSGTGTASPSVTTRDSWGGLIGYILSANTGRLRMWNSSKCLDENGLVTYQGGLKATLGIYGGQLRIVAGRNITATPNGSYNWTKGLEYDITSTPVTDTNSFNNALFDERNGVVLIRSSTQPVNNHQSWCAFDTKTGRYLWNNTWAQTAASSETILYTKGGQGLMAFEIVDDGTWRVVETRTGAAVKIIPNLDGAWGVYGQKAQYANNGLLMTTSYAGIVHAWDPNNGFAEVWSYAPDISYYAQPPSGSWFGGFGPAAGNIMTFRTIMTWPHGILEQGHMIHALDINTGKEVWNITGWYGSMALADGYLVGLNLYENKIYCFGIGTSGTSVTAPKIGVTAGQKIVIEGTVTDQTPGLAKGTAAVSDASMGNWMAYLYMNHGCPTDTQGVKVSLDAYDPNGNFVHIGDATSDATGVYAYVWAPELSGQYAIIATFQGNGAYGPSNAETNIYASEAHAETPTATPINLDSVNNSVMTYTLGAAIAIIIAIAILGLLLLRKRP